MSRRLAPALALMFALQAAACTGAPTSTTVNAMNAPPGIANIVRDRLRADLQRGASVSAPFTFPAKVRIIPYDYESGMNPNDVLSTFDGLAQDLMKAQDVVSEASVLPKAYGDSVGASFEALLALRGSTRADMFLLVSGRSRVVEDKEKFVWFWDRWADKSYWEAHTALDTLLIDAATGRFMPSLQAAGKAGPSFAAIEATASESSGYALKTAVERQAFNRLSAALVQRLRAEKANPTAVPSPTTSPPASAAPSPGASGVPSPTASAGFESGVGVDMGGLNGNAAPPPTANPAAGVIVGVLVGLVVLGALAGGSRRNARLLQAEERPLADAEVYLADAAGKKLTGFPTTRTDAEGRYQLAGIPTAGAYRLVASGTVDGAPVTRSTLVTVVDGETEASIDAATTYVATAGGAALLLPTCTLDAAAFETATARVAAAIAAGTPADLTDPTAIGATMAQLSLQAPDLASAMLGLVRCP